MEQNAKNPFFLYFSYYAVHTPLQGKEEYIKHFEPKGNELNSRDVLTKVDDRAFSRMRQTNPVYAANIKSMDESIGRIMETLKSLGLDKNTIIVFTSDNGGFSTTKGGNPQLPTSNLPLRFGKGWMYEGGVRVPAIVKYADKIKARTRSEQVICGYDFYPTLLALAELPSRPNLNLDGVDIFDTKSKKNLKNRDMYWYYPIKHASGHTPSAMMRKGNYKLIYDLKTNETKLFDVKKDISEELDLSKNKKKISDSMKIDLLTFLNTNKPGKYFKGDVGAIQDDSKPR